MLAPTGTIGFMMDCDTTGIEPDIALVKYKKLVGGGMIKIVNQTVPMALQQARLHATAGQGDRRVHRRERHDRGRAAPQGRRTCRCSTARSSRRDGRPLDPLHGPRPDDGRRAAVHLRRDLQDREHAEGRTVEEIEQAYIESWRLGLKAVAIYRDGCKRTQPLNTSTATRTRRTPQRAGRAIDGSRPVAGKLPDERHALTHKFDIAGHEGYITVGLFEDGQPGEIFLVMAKEGSTISGLVDAFAQAISYALQYGVPLQDLVDKFSHVRFEPSGMTKNPDVRFAKSIVDYIFRWMATKFLSPDAQFRAGVNVREDYVSTPEQLALDVAAAAGAAPTAAVKSLSSFAAIQNQEDAPPCSTCGSIMVRSGSCYKCANCGTTSGCA